MTLERHPAVVAEDLPSIYAFIAGDNPAAAERVLEAIERSFEQLARQPECGVRYGTRNRKLRDIRMLPVIGFAHYLIFYRSEGETVRILYVLHGAQYLRRFFHQKPRE